MKHFVWIKGETVVQFHGFTSFGREALALHAVSPAGCDLTIKTRTRTGLMPSNEFSDSPDQTVAIRTHGVRMYMDGMPAVVAVYKDELVGSLF